MFPSNSLKKLVNKPLLSQKTETKDEVTHTFVAEKPSTPNYGKAIGKKTDGFTKTVETITKEPWTSEKLGKSGDYYHGLVYLRKRKTATIRLKSNLFVIS